MLFFKKTGRCLLFASLPSLWSLGRGRFVPFVLACECDVVAFFAWVDGSGCCNPPVVGVVVVVGGAVAVVANGCAAIAEFAVVAVAVVVVVVVVVAVDPAVVATVATAAAAAMALPREGTVDAAPVRCTTSTLDIATVFPIARPVSSDLFYCDSDWLSHSDAVPSTSCAGAARGCKH